MPVRSAGPCGTTRASVLGRVGRVGRVGRLGRLVGGGQAFLPDLVEPGGQPLGQPPRVGEHQRGAVRRDEVDDALLDVWPDRGPALLPGRGTAEVLGQLAERGHVGQRYDDLEVPLLGRRRLHDLDRTAAGEIAGHLLHGANGGRQPDALCGLGEQLVETLQRQRQVRAPLGTRDRVDLVDDDRLHAGERLSGARGEHEEQRLRSGDEDVGRRPDERPTVGGGGVAGADRDGDVGRRQSEPGGGVSDPDERGPQVALDVDGQGLERRDVEDPAALLRRRGRFTAGQPVERPEERRQRLARTGRRHHEGVMPRADRRPRSLLGGSGRAERPPEPRRGGGGEPLEHVTSHQGAQPATAHRHPIAPGQLPRTSADAYPEPARTHTPNQPGRIPRTSPDAYPEPARTHTPDQPRQRPPCQQLRT